MSNLIDMPVLYAYKINCAVISGKKQKKLIRQFALLGPTFQVSTPWVELEGTVHWRRNRGGGAGPPLGKKGGPAPYLPPPPLFMVHLSLPCPQYINLSANTLGTAFLGLSMCQRSLKGS